MCSEKGGKERKVGKDRKVGKVENIGQIIATGNEGKNRNSKKSSKNLQIVPKFTWLQVGPNESKLIQMCLNLKLLSGYFEFVTVYLGLVIILNAYPTLYLLSEILA